MRGLAKKKSFTRTVAPRRAMTLEEIEHERLVNPFFDPAKDNVAVEGGTQEYERIGSERLIEGEGKPPSGRVKHDFSPQVRSHYTKLGYVVHRVDRFDPRSMHTYDLYGIADFTAIDASGLARPRVWIQVTSKDHIGDHLMKICSQKPIGAGRKAFDPKGEDGQSRLEYLRLILQNREEVHIIGFEQPSGLKGSKWVAEVLNVTAEVVDNRAAGNRRVK